MENEVLFTLRRPKGPDAHAEMGVSAKFSNWIPGATPKPKEDENL
jgi:hypothetical protein